MALRVAIPIASIGSSEVMSPSTQSSGYGTASPTLVPSSPLAMHRIASDVGADGATGRIPLTALSRNTKRQLSNALNTRKILRSEEGYERDWRGIAALSQQKNLCEETALSGEDAMTKVLQLWCSNSPKTATFGNLERFLGIIDRWDVSDDISENLAEDAKNYNAKQQRKQLAVVDENAPFEDATTLCDVAAADFGFGTDASILTEDDVLRAQKGLPPQQYDAFVLYADADIDFATEMLNKLEDNPDSNFKLCLKNRDVVAGVAFAHVALTQLIEERCKHLIVILTTEFLKSPENNFLLHYTQAFQIQHNTRKIIPLIYDNAVVVPKTLRIYTHLKYNTNAGGLFNFWGKLAASISNVHQVAATSEASHCARPPKSMTLPRHTKFVGAAHSPSINLATLPTPPTEIPSISINGHAFEPDDIADGAGAGVAVAAASAVAISIAVDDESATKKERLKPKKRHSLRNSASDVVAGCDDVSGDARGTRYHKWPKGNGAQLRSSHSTSQLNASGYRDVNGSLSDLSTSSGYSYTKKKKNWASKLYKKVFSRSSTKLQETA